ncbi:MAG: R3H domain-containing nucleic acid-binding protein [Candidatus Zhuqueibacterota bacterium]
MKNQQRNSSFRGKRSEPSRESLAKIDQILIDAQKRLRDTLEPVSIENLNGFERKKIHGFFDSKPEYVTKTYRRGESYVLKVFPVGNLKKLAKDAADKVLASGETIMLPYLDNFERFIVHDYLKDFDGIETKSIGEGQERRLEIRQAKFGRSLKRIIKKIKLL